MTQEEFDALLSNGRVLLDGATGSNLMKAGMPKGVCTEDWILEHPEPLSKLQKAYVEAGSQIIYAATFSANRCSLSRYGMEKRVGEINRRLMELSQNAAAGKALVAGDMTTTGIALEPKGTMEYNELFDIYAEQAEILAEAGADLLVVETMLGIDETTVALEAAKSVCKLPVMCSMTVQADGSLYFGGFCTDAVQPLTELGAAAVGINCSLGPEQLTSIVRNMKAEKGAPLLVKPNAGMPELTEQGEAVYPMNAEDFAGHMGTLIEAGADIIGGCCGTTPEFIRLLREKYL